MQITVHQSINIRGQLILRVISSPEVLKLPALQKVRCLRGCHASQTLPSVKQKKREISHMICNHNNLQMINAEQQHSSALSKPGINCSVSANKEKKGTVLCCPGTFRLYLIKVEFCSTSLYEAACVIATTLPESLVRSIRVHRLRLCSKPPKEGPLAQRLLPDPAAATGPLPAAWKGHQHLAFSGDFEQGRGTLKHTSTH